MHKILLISAAGAGLLFSAVPAAAETFDGPYVGVNAGWNRAEIADTLGDDIAIDEEVRRDSASFGIYGGYNYRLADKVVLGAEGGFSINADDDLFALSGGDAVQVQPRYNFDLSARAGYLVSDKALVFVRGGYVNERVRTEIVSEDELLRAEDNLDGWSVGGGVEYALTSNISARLEYRYADLGSDDGSYDRHQTLLGVSYNF